MITELAHRISEQFRQSVDHFVDNREVEQSLIRLVIATMVLSYLIWAAPAIPDWTKQWTVAFSMIFVFLFCSGLLYYWSRQKPHLVIKRRILSILLDVGGLGVGMSMTGDMLVPWVPVYLWVTFGNGLRFGLPYLVLSATLSVIAFTFVLVITPFWREHLELALGFLVSLVVLPFYVGVLIKRLYKETEHAQEASLAKSEFLAHMSHEIRTPLNGVVVTAELLGDCKSEKETREYGEVIRASGQNLLRLIEDILDISKIEAGKIEIETVKFDFHELITTTVKIFIPQASSKGLSLRHNIGLDIPYQLTGDQTHLRQILINLIGNAIKFTETGSVELCCFKTRESEEGLTLIRFEVVDTGIGIEEEAQQKIFDKFTQADGSTTRRYGGSGLGITIAKQLVELLGGRIGVSSTPNIGTTFWFDLEFESLDSVEDQNSTDTLHSCKVLRYSPRPDITTSTLNCLDLWSIPYETVSSASSTISKLNMLVDNKPFDTLIIDGLTDDMSTRNLIKGLNEKLLHKDVTIVIVQKPGLTTSIPSIDVQSIYLLEEPLDKTMLFNALHVSNSIDYEDDTVVSLPLHSELRNPNRRPLKILAAEDNKVSRMLIGRVLERAGHTYRLVKDGQEMLDVFMEESFDLIIADLRMPIVNGLEVFQMIRMSNSMADPIPYIILTADATSSVFRQCQDVGIRYFLTKPTSSKKLLETIEKATSHLRSSVAEDVEKTSDGKKRTDETIMPLPLVDGGAFQKLVVFSQDQGFVKKLLEQFSSEGETNLALMEAALDANDDASFHDHIHALKGSALEMGLQKLGALAAKAETLTLADIQTTSPDLLAEIKRLFKDSVNALANRINDTVHTTH